MSEPRSALSLCADASRALGEDPISTAPHWQEVTVLELDVPLWAKVRDTQGWTAEQAAVFEGLRGKVEHSGAGFGLLMSAPQVVGGPLRVRHYTLSNTTGGYIRRDYTSSLPQSEWARGLHDTLLVPERLSESCWQATPTLQGQDLHVCTHGTVDASCGKYGVPVFAALSSAADPLLRAWRTGHFGGHRFAATAISLPAGLAWAHLTPGLALAVAQRRVTPAEVGGHLRGYVGLPPLAQVLDRQLLIERGWNWLEAVRYAEIAQDTVTLHATWQGQAEHISARVTLDHTLSVQSSSHKPGQSQVPQYGVSAYQVRYS